MLEKGRGLIADGLFFIAGKHGKKRTARQAGAKKPRSVFG
jgi:hypothetical protein